MQWESQLAATRNRGSLLLGYRNVCTLAIHADGHVFACNHARVMSSAERCVAGKTNVFRASSPIPVAGLISASRIKLSAGLSLSLLVAEGNALPAALTRTRVIALGASHSSARLFRRCVLQKRFVNDQQVWTSWLSDAFVMLSFQRRDW